ncbi:hypothetical protein ACET3X_003248 [Alternaria dauci]|uniref:Uncharacterized protein n=1 Tax=Alternaria dauci TaxID=48095 RepID=A0ABR3URZ3_9PLEO
MARSESYHPFLSTWEHPWSLTILDTFSDYELRNYYELINDAIKHGDVSILTMSDMRVTQRRIKRALEARNVPIINLWDSWDYDLGSVRGVRGVGFLRRGSPDIIIRPTVEQRVINIPAPQPSITFQTIEAPSPNITYKTIQAPQPAALPQQPELPKRIRIRDQWGHIVEERNETEQEKSDREFEEWKEKFGAK